MVEPQVIRHTHTAPLGPPDEPQVHTRMVTPSQAALWLKSNSDRNRNLSKRKVAQYARDMLAGRWKLTHQGLGFDVDGQLIDGQHRLAAIVSAEVTIEMMVATGLSKDAYGHVDVGYTRSVADTITAMGRHKDVKRLKTVISMARYCDNGHRRALVDKTMSADAHAEQIDAHHDALTFANDFTTPFTQRRGMASGPVLGAIAAAFYFEDHLILAQFRDELLTGLTVNPMIVKFREHLREPGGAASGGGNSRVDLYWMTQRVIKAFCDGENLTKFYQPTAPVYIPATAESIKV